MPMSLGLAADKECMVELFSSEDNSSSEEELVKQVNTVETSKGADAGLTVGCQVVSTVDSLFLGSEGSQFASSGAPASSTSLQGGRFCKQLQQATDTDTHNSCCSFAICNPSM